MAKERDLLKILFSNIINSIKPRNFQGKLIGEDHFGTKYYEIPLNTYTSRSKPERYFEPSEKNKFDQDLPAEWESWLRYRRKDPPTTEEVLNNVALANLKKENAAKLDLQYGERSTILPPLPSFPAYEEYELTPGQEDKKNKN